MHRYISLEVDYAAYLREPERFGLTAADVNGINMSMQGMLRIYVDPLIGMEAKEESLNQYVRESGSEFLPLELKTAFAELSGR
jgi:hypothetical protein